MKEKKGSDTVPIEKKLHKRDSDTPSLVTDRSRTGRSRNTTKGTTETTVTVTCGLCTEHQGGADARCKPFLGHGGASLFGGFVREHGGERGTTSTVNPPKCRGKILLVQTEVVTWHMPEGPSEFLPR